MQALSEEVREKTRAQNSTSLVLLHKLITTFLFFSTIFFQGVSLYGQGLSSTFYFNSTTDEYVIEQVAKFNRKGLRTELNLHKDLNRFTEDLQKNGYFTASIDSMMLSDDTFRIWFYCGKRYSSSILHLNNDEPAIGELAEIISGYSAGKPRLPGPALSAITGVLNRQGYPLARVSILEMKISDDTLITYISVDRGSYYVWDSLEIRGDININNAILQKIIKVRANKPYNNLLLPDVEKHLGTLPFLTAIGSYNIILTDGGKARLLLNLGKQKASGFNGIVGFGPDKLKPEKLIFSGDVTLKLHNAFGRAEEMDLSWQGIQGDEQLMLNFRQPYLRWLPFGIMGKFALLKKGDLFYRLNIRGGIVAMPGPGSSFSVWTDRTSSRVLDRSIYTNATTLPPVTDFETTLFGLGYAIERVDLRINPGKGYYFSGEIAAGKMNILRSTDIPGELFEGVETEGRQAQGELTLGFYIPVTPRLIINSMVHASGIYGTVASENSFFYIGGINTLRGFDERSITASSFALGSLELRYRFERASHFKVFVDGGWYEKRLIAHNLFHDTPFGFGAGISLPSPAGHLQISYAWGIQNNNPFDFKTGRLHFGLDARF